MKSSTKKEKKKQSKRLLGAARAILRIRYNVSSQYLDRFDATCRYIWQVCSPLVNRHGWDLIQAFVDRHQPKPTPASNEFLMSFAWRRLRMEVLRERGARCECCGATPEHGIRINVDHIKPRKLFPTLALEKSNLQVLCEDCNHGKGNQTINWRGDGSPTQTRR